MIHSKIMDDLAGKTLDDTGPDPQLLDSYMRGLCEELSAAPPLSHEVQSLEPFLGVEHCVCHSSLGLLFDGVPVKRSCRRWSEVLSVAGGGVFIWQRPLAEAQLRGGENPIMYEAYRDVLPPRRSTEVSLHAPDTLSRTELVWRVDLVVYQSGVLPTGELHRSVGHWNPLDEWEVFQVWRGSVAILSAQQPAPGLWQIEVVECGPGDSYVIAPGAWHLTYPLAGQPVVINIYSASASARPLEQGSTSGKYEARSHHGPPIGIVRRGNETQAIWHDGRIETSAPFTQPDGAPFLRRGESPDTQWLGRWFLRSSQEDFERGLARLAAP